MSYKTPLVLFVIAAALGLFVFLGLPRLRPSVEDPRDRKPFEDLREEDVRAVEIAAEGRTIVIERREGAEPVWEVVTPAPAARADGSVVASLLSDLRFLSPRGGVEAAAADDRGAAHFGLDAPAATVTCRTAARAFTLALGAENPLKKDEVFARAEGEPGVLIVEKRLLDTLRKPPEEFQDRSCFTFDSWKAEAIAMTLAGEAVELVKQDSDWRLAKPEEIREKADYSPVSTLLSTLRDIRWREFVEAKPADPAAFGLAPPAARFAVTVAETKKTETLLVGAPRKDAPDRVYARRGDDGPVVTIEASVLEKLPKRAEEFRSRKLFDLAADSLRRLSVEAGASKCVLEREKEGTGWTAAVPVGLKVDGEAVSDLAAALNAATVKEFYERRAAALQTYGLDAPAASLALTVKSTVTTTTGEGEKKETKTEDTLVTRLWRFGVKGRQVFVQRDGSGEVVEIEPKLLERLQLGPVGFRSRRLVDTTPAALQSVAIERTERGAASPVRAVCEREAGQWTLKAPAGRTLDPQRINDAVAALHALRALRWVPPAEAAAAGLDRPILRVEFAWTEAKAPPPPADGAPAGKPDESPAETRRLALRVGAAVKARDGHYAQLEGDPDVFILPKAAVDSLDQDLFSLP